jgi:hypothetical protein
MAASPPICRSKAALGDANKLEVLVVLPRLMPLSPPLLALPLEPEAVGGGFDDVWLEDVMVAGAWARLDKDGVDADIMMAGAAASCELEPVDAADEPTGDFKLTDAALVPAPAPAPAAGVAVAVVVVEVKMATPVAAGVG